MNKNSGLLLYVDAVWPEKLHKNYLTKRIHVTAPYSNIQVQDVLTLVKRFMGRSV